MIVIASPRVRRIMRKALPFVLIPSVVVIGAVAAGEKRYAFISLAVAVMAVALFLCGFDKKKTGSRRLVLCAVMCALSVAGRFIPLFKPVTAVTMLAGMWLGGESGFLVGSMSALVSNFYFGQGPWTPFQMFAWGMIGLIAGLASNPLKRGRALLYISGAAAGVLYSMILDVWTVLWYNGSLRLDLYLAAMTTALPHTLLYAASNVIFLLLLARPFGEKLSRIKIKYGV